jgi:hypothetical protein
VYDVAPASKDDDLEMGQQRDVVFRDADDEKVLYMWSAAELDKYKPGCQAPK